MTFAEAIQAILAGKTVHRKSWTTPKYLAIYGEVMVIGLGSTNVLYYHDLVADDWEEME